MRTIISFKMADILATTGAWEDVILRGFPKEAPPYKSLWLPFDSMTWLSVFGTLIIVSLTLLAIEIAWSKMGEEGHFKKDGLQ